MKKLWKIGLDVLFIVVCIMIIMSFLSGCQCFVIATGYKSEAIKEFFLKKETDDCDEDESKKEKKEVLTEESKPE